jgi:DNA-binding NarL/FixJ family response regulator
MKTLAFIDLFGPPPDGAMAHDLVRQQRDSTNQALIAALAGEYQVRTYDQLGPEVVQAVSRERPDVVITHVPYDPQMERAMHRQLARCLQEKQTESFNQLYAMLYANSLDCLKKWKDGNAPATVIAFTGADAEILPDETLHANGADFVVRRGGPHHDPDEAIARIVRHLAGQPPGPS